MDDSARKTLSDFSELMLDWKSELSPNINAYEIGYNRYLPWRYNTPKNILERYTALW